MMYAFVTCLASRHWVVARVRGCWDLALDISRLQSVLLHGLNVLGVELPSVLEIAPPARLRAYSKISGGIVRRWINVKYLRPS